MVFVPVPEIRNPLPKLLSIVTLVMESDEPESEMPPFMLPLISESLIVSDPEFTIAELLELPVMSDSLIVSDRPITFKMAPPLEPGPARLLESVLLWMVVVPSL